MPTSPLMEIPKSRSAKEFESICKDILEKKYGSRFVKYGRDGQKQNGIDIYNKSSSNSYTVAQCKNYFNQSSVNRLIKAIRNDINSLNNLPFYKDINKFIVMTSMDRDRKVQDDISSINCGFSIELCFWEYIQEAICSNDDLVKKYYPQFYKSKSNSISIESLIKVFNASMSKNRIVEFLQEDPTGGIALELVTKVDIFVAEVKENLDSVPELQNNNQFKDIRDFINIINEYNEYLSRLLHYNGHGYCTIQNPNIMRDLDEIKKNIHKVKIDLNNIYSRINEGCSLFY